MSNIIYTIGHSTQPIESFVALLQKHAVTLICDVRSQPYSRVNPQFNRENLQQGLKARDIVYLFLGKELGARSDDETVYVNGKVCYDLLAKTAVFGNGLKKVQVEAKNNRIALMCAERDPLACHRTILIGRHLYHAGWPVAHILEDGSLEAHEQAVARLLRLLRFPESDMFRSQSEVIEEAYKIQGERIAYDPIKAVSPGMRKAKDAPV